jgi:penicillin-insensitive murein endopeptidase
MKNRYRLLALLASAGSVARHGRRYPSRSAAARSRLARSPMAVSLAALPLNAVGYQVMRTDQRRYFGHPDLIQFIQPEQSGAQ